MANPTCVLKASCLQRTSKKIRVRGLHLNWCCSYI
jgi:hypothetical protein